MIWCALPCCAVENFKESEWLLAKILRKDRLLHVVVSSRDLLEAILVGKCHATPLAMIVSK
jgi:hypothetical protein